MNASCYTENYKESQPLPTYYRLYVYVYFTAFHPLNQAGLMEKTAAAADPGPDPTSAAERIASP